MFIQSDRYTLKLLLQYSIFLITLISTNTIVNLAYAAESAGRIIMASGSVEAVNNKNGLRTLKRGNTVYRDDTIKTGENSRVQIRFIDNALVALNENSELTIKTYIFNGTDSQDNQVLMELVKGGFRTLSGKIGKNNQQAYQVTAPSASIGIRGTSYQLQTVSERLLVAVWQGGIVLQTLQGQFDLGINADFYFAEISSTGIFKGLLNPPNELTLVDQLNNPKQPIDPTLWTLFKTNTLPITDILGPFERDTNAFAARNILDKILSQDKQLKATDIFNMTNDRNYEVLMDLYGITPEDISNFYYDQTEYPSDTGFQDDIYYDGANTAQP